MTTVRTTEDSGHWRLGEQSPESERGDHARTGLGIEKMSREKAKQNHQHFANSCQGF